MEARMLAAPFRRMKSVIPTVMLLGMAPQTFIIWCGWRVISIVMPAWLYQKGEDIIFGLYQRIILFFFEHVIGTEVLLYGDAEEALKSKERVLYLANHQSDVDWIIAHMMAARQGMLGQVRYILKDSIQFVPLYGHYLYQHGCIYVKRGKFNPWKMTRALKYLQDPKIQTWLVVFPEGTRFNPSSKQLLERSKKAAIDQGMEPLKNVLTPKVRGVSLSLAELRNHFDAIYDVTALYEGTADPKTGRRITTPNMFEFLTMKPKLHIHLNRININTVPTDEAELKDWLNKLFIHKNKLVSSFYANNNIKSECPAEWMALGQGTPSRLSFWSTVPAFVLFTGILIPCVLFSTGRQLYWKTLLFGTIGGYIWLLVRSVA